MKIRHFYIIISILSLWSANAFPQINCITDPPLPPVLTSVSVQPETGNTKLSWSLSTSPDIAGYVLYSFKNGDGLPVDTIWDPSAENYTLTSTATKYFSVSYVVAAIRRPRCTSIFSNALSSIFEEVYIDTCTNKIDVSWNSYTSFPVKVTGYSVLMSVNGNNFTEQAVVGPEETKYSLSNFMIDANYCFVIRANLEGGAISTSNKTCLSTKMKRPPQWINADQATINSEGKVNLTFTIDPFSELTHFKLERKTGAAGTFQEISRPVSATGLVQYTDNKADIKSINYYRLSAVNSCNIEIIESNLASNIVLALEKAGDKIILSWNSYKDWLGNISSYKLFANTGKGFEEKADIPASDTVFLLSYQQIMYEVSGDNVCFYITAAETSNPYGISGETRSSEICTDPTELITVPNVFTPNNDLNNDLFRPVLSFTPADYHLIISDRKGNVLFETTDYLASWDGTRNGSPQPQGVYLWFLKITTPSGKVISRTGTITILTDR